MDTRCDRCGARPMYRYEHGDQRLTLCGHHGQKHGQALRDAGWFTYRIAQLAHA